jgi:hypothetical protein
VLEALLQEEFYDGKNRRRTSISVHKACHFPEGCRLGSKRSVAFSREPSEGVCRSFHHRRPSLTPPVRPFLHLLSTTRITKSASVLVAETDLPCHLMDIPESLLHRQLALQTARGREALIRAELEGV